MKNKTFTVYISGKIGDLDLEATKAKFRAAQIKLNAKGWNAVIPFDLITNPASWSEAMIADTTPIFNNEFDGMYMLNDWRTSRGARIERIIAQELGLFIAYQPK